MLVLVVILVITYRLHAAVELIVNKHVFGACRCRRIAKERANRLNFVFDVYRFSWSCECIVATKEFIEASGNMFNIFSSEMKERNINKSILPS